jgi:hypothetical protein
MVATLNCFPDETRGRNFCVRQIAWSCIDIVEQKADPPAGAWAGQFRGGGRRAWLRPCILRGIRRARRGIRWRGECIDRKRRQVASIASIEHNEIVLRQAGNGAAMAIADDNFELDQAALGPKNRLRCVGMAAEANFAGGESLRCSEQGGNAKRRDQAKNY